jgi:signal transduction histidine kinase
MTEIVGQASPGTAELTHVLANPLPLANSRDELSRLAFTFNRLFNRVDVVLRQLRQFVTDASHELRTPLAVLRGEAELLLSEATTVEECKTTVRVMEAELRKLTRIVEGLFTLSMADAGQLRLTREPLYLDEVVEQACTRLAPVAHTKGIRIRRDLTRDLSYLGDEAFLQELGVIFLDNAIKYSPCDTEIYVKLERAGNQVRIQFRDQGYGIADEDRPHIFERFFRGHQSGGSESRSGGLGLAIAKALVDAQNGSIVCDSTPGRQTTFTITLPYLPVADEGSSDADQWSGGPVFETTDVPGGDHLSPVA